jgi:hypothetical protein
MRFGHHKSDQRPNSGRPAPEQGAFCAYQGRIRAFKARI